METLRYLISKTILLIVIIVCLWGTTIIVKKFFPAFSLFSPVHFFTDDWLPDPVNRSALNEPEVADLTPYLYKGERSSWVSYVQYTKNGMNIINPAPNVSATTTLSNGFSPVDLYLRRLSIYTGGMIYTGLSFTGEARNTFFNKGTFPIYVTDINGRIVDTEIAYATSDWTVPGWTRFTVTIKGVLPVRTMCALVFRAASGSSAGYSGTQVAVPEMCN